MSNTKSSKRRGSVASYYQRNQDTLREKARLRMSRLRASNALKSEDAKAKAAASKRASQAKYRESHRDVLRAKAARRRVSKRVLADIIAQFGPAARVNSNANNDYGNGNGDYSDGNSDYGDVSDSGYMGDANLSDSEGESEAADQTIPTGNVAKATSTLPKKFAERRDIPRWLEK